MAFGRSFESALAAYFRGEDCGAALFKEWGAYRDAPFEYKKGDTWDRLVHQGAHLLQRFVQNYRIRIHHPGTSLQIKILASPPRGAEFVASALNNIAVFDLAPLEESPVKKRLFAKLNDAHHDEL